MGGGSGGAEGNTSPAGPRAARRKPFAMMAAGAPREDASPKAEKMRRSSR